MGRVSAYIAILAVPLSACTESYSEGPLGPRGLSSSRAVVTSENVVFDADIVDFVSCANRGVGEVVQVSGRLHDTIHVTTNDNHFVVKLHTQPQGIRGVGLTTGTKYQGTGVTQERFGGSLSNGQFSDTFVNNFRIIGQGPGNNLLIHQNLHVTFNAKGELTAELDHLSITCK